LSVTLRDIAQALKLDVEQVRRILSESPGSSAKVTKDTLDKVFGTARKLGYDFKKLKIGKQMGMRKAIFEEILSQIEAHPSWSRSDIVKYLQQSSEMIERVHKRSFKEEFGEE
jgi:DNA-binding LacI/PurR family transcriptional regulator